MMVTANELRDLPAIAANADRDSGRSGRCLGEVREAVRRANVLADRRR